MGTTTIDPAAQIVGWVCSNQGWVIYVIGILLAHSGFSVLSAFLKKMGITSDSPIVGMLIPIIRAVAIDVKPPAATVVSQAATIMAESDSVQANAVAPVVAQAAVDMKAVAAIKTP